FTEPSPVHDLKIKYIDTTSVILTWLVNNTASNSYRIEFGNSTFMKNLATNGTEVEITGLIPGTMYNFTIFAEVNGNETEGVAFSLYTKPSPVLHLEAEYVGETSVNLTWNTNDTASNSYTYRIEVVNDSSIRNLTSTVTKAEITELVPGTMYNFTVFAVAADNETEGEGRSKDLYTKPSPVLHLEAEYVGETSVNLTWDTNDTASNSYTYRIEFVNDSFIKNLTSTVTKAEIRELFPGTMYNFTVFAVAADNETEGEGKSKDLYT
ncbi:PTPRJ phosphatase, partial [Calyptomena viridis]|nr:PTPRJ phosphatase [Calyptomena viridis]